MLFQIHHQNIKLGKARDTKLCFQFEANNQNDLERAMQKAWEEFPPPAGFQFLVCNEDSHFFKTNELINEMV